MSNPVTTRAMKESDIPFIYSSYLKSYRNAPGANHMVNDVYYPEYKARMEKMLSSSNVLVACSSEDPDQILGYVIYDSAFQWTIIHYLYIKFPFRQMKLASGLINLIHPQFGKSMTIVSHLPKGWNTNSKKYQLVYDPSYARAQ